MTRAEVERGFGVQGSGFGGQEPVLPEPRPLNPIPSRIARYFVTTGWAHLTLLTGVGIFLFPFLWMLSTSLKTDDELSTAAILPEIPTFRAASPYVRRTTLAEKPMDVSTEQWDKLLPRLTELATAQVTQAQRSDAAQTTRDHVPADEHRDAAARVLVANLVGKLNKELWQSEAGLIPAFKALLTPEAAQGALDEALARLDIYGLQLRTLDTRIFTLCTGGAIADAWRIESGGGTLVKTADATRLQYRFASSSAAPLVLRYDFPLPPGVKPDDLHKLILSIRADDSWHRIDAELVAGPDRWLSQRTTYLAQHRAMSILFQPPTFDDTTDRPKTWVPLRRVPAADGVAPVGGVADPVVASPTPPTASMTLRLTLSPSSTLQAISGKVQRNYARAFNSVPFWKYIANSLILVVLVTGGALFSASFVAYAFARLHWPGRGVAFIILLATMMLPAQVTMIPSFMIWRQVGWYNTLNPLWVPAWFGGAFFIFLMTQHMKTIPRELEEAARIDGLNAVQSWWYIIMPQVKPTLAAIAIMTFMGAWNEFMGPLIYLRDQDKFPLSLGLFGIRLDFGADWTMVMAGNLLMTLPVILVFFLFQRYFIQGMTMSGMKG